MKPEIKETLSFLLYTIWCVLVGFVVGYWSHWFNSN